MKMTILPEEVSGDLVERLVHAFYARVRADGMRGTIFEPTSGQTGAHRDIRSRRRVHRSGRHSRHALPVDRAHARRRPHPDVAAAAFRARVRSNDALAYGVMLQLSGYWRKLNSQIKDLKLLSATERLSALLLALASRGADPIGVMLPGNRSLVAGLLGVAPQSLSRAFATPRPIGVSGADEKLPLPTRPGCVNSPTPVH